MPKHIACSTCGLTSHDHDRILIGVLFRRRHILTGPLAASSPDEARRTPIPWSSSRVSTPERNPVPPGFFDFPEQWLLSRLHWTRFPTTFSNN